MTSADDSTSDPQEMPGPFDAEALDRIADQILADQTLDGELEGDSSQASASVGGLSWIRSTLRTGGDAHDELVGSLFHDKYRILRKIGTGGFGVVYDALDERGAQNRVALKIMRPGLTQSSSPLDMFRGEAVRVTRLHHPNIVDWKSFDRTPEGQYYFVMELLEGEQLSKILEREGSLDWRRASRLLLQILGALRAAHFVGEGESILHLDLTPKNILILPRGHGRAEAAKVIDFGIGQYLGGDELAPLEVDSNPNAAPPVPAEVVAGSTVDLRTVTSGTKNEQVFKRRAARYPFKISQACTPEYASPEQCVHIEFADGAENDPEPLDGRADLYSFGVIAYRMLTGRLPFKKPGVRALFLHLHQTQPIEPWGDAEARVPASLRRFVERCLEKRREDRWADTQEAFEALERLQRPLAWRRFLLAAVALVLFGVALAQLGRTQGNGTFELQHDSDPEATEVSALYFGPSRTSIPLYARTPEADALDEHVEWSVVDTEGEPLPGWRVEPEGRRGWLLVSAVDPIAPSIRNRYERERVRLRSRSPQEMQSNSPFRLVWLGEDCGSYELRHGEKNLASGVARATLEDPLEIDPNNLELELEFPLSRPVDLVANDCRFTVAGRAQPFVLDDQVTATRFKCRFDGLGPGPHRARVELRDKAEGLWWIELDLHVVEALPGVTARLEYVGGSSQPWAPGKPLLAYPDDDLNLLVEAEGPVWIVTNLEDFGPERTLVSGSIQERINDQELFHSHPEGLDLEVQLSHEVIHDESRESYHAKQLALRLDFIERRSIALELTSDQLAYDSDDPILASISAPSATGELILRCTVDGGPFRSQQLEHQTAERTLDLRELLREAGASELVDATYSIEVDVHVLREGDERSTESPNSSETLEFTLDSRAPSVGLEDSSLLATGWIVESLDEELRLIGERGVELEWTLLREGEPILTEDKVPAESVDDRWEWTVSPLQGLASSHHDGPARLRFSATDEARNSTTLEDLEVVIARSPPQIRFHSLGSFAGVSEDDWDTTASKELETIVARISDPNDLGWVDCRVFQHAGALDQDDLDRLSEVVGFEGVQRLPSAKDGLYRWSFDPDVALSSKGGIYIAILAEDKYGNAHGVASGPFRLPKLHVKYRARLGDMWLVPKNREARYVFGGVGHEQENQRRAALGFPPNWVGRGDTKLGETREAWALRVPVDGIDDYYLDEREVSVGDYLEFLDDEDGGYSHPRHWFEGQAPGPVRVARLRELYLAREPAEPATGLRFDEARAYAHWAGKRLPTLLELSYAIRGGELYRVHSWDFVPSRDAADEDSPWHRIHGLCRGAEWTCTPQWSPPLADARNLPISLAAIELPSSSQLKSAQWFRVLGRLGAVSSDATLWTNDFRDGESRHRKQLHAALGFRCALSAADAEGWVDTRPSQEPDNSSSEERE